MFIRVGPKLAQKCNKNITNAKLEAKTLVTKLAKKWLFDQCFYCIFVYI